jgi:aminotransferase
MINVFGSYAGNEELQNVKRSIENQWLGAGKFVKEFEKEFSAHKGISNFLMVDNASNGLFLACHLLELPAGAEVILPSFTCIACAQAIKMAGYTPIFCDVDLDTQNISAEHIYPHLNSQTGAIMIVHYAGLPVDMDPIKSMGIKIIEDVAHAVDSKYKSAHCGTIGDIGVFSFDPMKNLASCEGGGMIIKENRLYSKAKQMRLCGVGSPCHEISGQNSSDIWWEDHAEEYFIKTYPNDISAGIALAQLKKLEILQQRRKQIWDYYTEQFSHIPSIKCPKDASGDSIHSYFTYLIQVPNRDELAFYLRDKSIYTTLKFFPLHLNKRFNTGQSLHNSEYLSKSALNIPLHPNLSDNEVEYIVGTIVEFFRKKV